ncbi:MAG: protein kinase [Labilithrix sp.]|nr:protein kinase [Labilithrix sp.]
MSLTDGIPSPGTILAGKFLVEGLLGRGGMGIVLAARHQQLDQKVAIKLLLEEARKHPDVVERFAREARAAAKIQGEHVARVIDVGVLEDGAPYMVMEHLEGRDLAAELRARGRLSVGEVVRWILEACEAIAQAHAARIVHRDLKPGNLFLARQPDGRSLVKVLDFGISKSVDPNAPALTKTSSLVGTPYYMAPEQLTAAKSVDTRADIWALGVIMYELVAGHPPFDAQSMPEIVAAILTNQPAPLDSVRAGVPEGLARAVERCMKSNPEDRYPSVAAVAYSIAPFATGNEDARVERIARVLGVMNPHTETLPPDTELAPIVGPSNLGPALRPPAEGSGVSGVEKTMLLPDSSANVGLAPQPPVEAVPSGDAPVMSALATTNAAPDAPSVPTSKSELAGARSITGLSTSQSPEQPKPPIGRGLAIAAVVGALAVGAATFALVGRGPAPAAREIVATASTVSSGLVPAPPVDSAAAFASASSSAEPTPTAAMIETSPTVSATVGAAEAPAPLRSATKPTRPVTSTAPTTTAPPAVSAPQPAPLPSKNPLDMGIK